MHRGGVVLGTGILVTFLHAMLAVGAATPPAARPVISVTVRADTAVARDRWMVGDVLRYAHDIWRPYADVTFELAGSARPAQSLQLVITDRVSPVSDPASLGWIEFVDGKPSNVITVSAAAAIALMQASRWGTVPRWVQRTFLVRALARAIAHELGHYLLASREHTAHGLMRGQLTADDIMQPWKSSYQLDSAQVKTLQRGALLARQGIQNSELGIQN